MSLGSSGFRAGDGASLQDGLQDQRASKVP